MVAPAAPVIRARQDGTRIYVRWQPVPNATDYKLYVSDEGGAFGLEDDIEDTEVDGSGWFFDITSPQDGVTSVKLTALNIGAEESADSNIVQFNLMGGSGEGGRPTKAIPRRRG